MDALLDRAIAGTSKALEKEPTNSPLSRLVSREIDSDRALLLEAGARAVYRMAGTKPLAAARRLAVSAAETAPPSSRACAAVLHEILRERQALIPEAAALLGERGRRLSFELLPLALAVKGELPRRALRPVLGERGRWLAEIETEWRWALDAGEEAASVEELGRLFEEGAPADRVSALRRLRALDAAGARERLASGFAKEKADFRALSLEALEAALTGEDEAFLEGCLDDRSGAVRAAAAALLARIPTSALARRMVERADAMIVWSPVAPKGGFFAKLGSRISGADGRFEVKPPTDLPKDWERDGLAMNVVAGEGKRSSWIAAVLSHVPPSHWVERFRMEPARVVALAGASDWKDGLVAGWCRSAIRFGDAAWAGPAWDATAALAQPERETLEALARLMSPEERRARLSKMVESPDTVTFPLLLAHLPKPWDDVFSKRWLDGVRRLVARSARGDRSFGDAFLTTFEIGAIGLAAERLADALDPWPEESSLSTEDYTQRYVANELSKLRDVLRIRKRLWESEP